MITAETTLVVSIYDGLCMVKRLITISITKNYHARYTWAWKLHYYFARRWCGHWEANRNRCQGITVSRPSYQELKKRNRELEKKSLENERIKAELLSQQSILKKQNIEVVRKSIELSDIMRILEDNNSKYETTQSQLQITLEALTVSENKYRNLFETAHDLIQSVAFDGRITDVNPRWCESMGYTSEEALKLNVKDIVHPRSQRTCKDTLKAAISGKSVEGIAVELITRSGQTITVSGNTSCRLKNGKPYAVWCLFRDITERERVMEELRQQYEFLSNVIDSLSQPFYIVDAADCTIQMANDIANLGDLSENPKCYEVAAHKVSNPSECEPGNCPVREVKKTKKPVIVEHIHYDRDGNPKNVEVHCYPLFDNNGNVVQVIRHCLDITEHKQTEEKVRESQEALRKIFEHVPFAIMSVGKDKIIRRVNDAFWAVSGQKSQNEVVGNICHKKICPAEEGRCPILDLGQEVESSERMLVTKDGKHIPILKSVVPITLYGEECLLEAFIDITERKRSQEELKQQVIRMTLLNRITRAIAERQDPESIFLVILHHLENDLTVDFSCIALFDQGKETLTVSSIGPGSRATAVGLGIEKGLPISIGPGDRERYREAEILYEPDTAEVNAPVLRQFSRAGICALVGSPMIVEDQLIGVLFVGRRDRGAFSSGECDFLRQLSEHTALAVKQKRLYEELEGAYYEIRETQKAVMEQERLRALGQMASGIAHDINNSLSPIVGFLDILLEKEPDLSERVRKYLGILKTAGMDIANTVGRLRAFYRERIDEQLQELNLNTLVGQVIDLTCPR